MGVRLLQTFLGTLRNANIKQVHLRQLNGKKIAVDISIYLYRFKGTGNLIESMYLMCSIFRYYNIHPIFVFDGKPKDFKKETLEKRYLTRQKAKDELKNLEIKMRNSTALQNKVDKLRKQTISVCKKDVVDVKDFLDVYGMTYITATNEADEVCAALCLKKMVYACLTEDTDLMAYGSPIIMRYFSLVKHTCVTYDMSGILNDINMTTQDFQELCACSGNDYINTERNIFYYYGLFKKYKTSSQIRFIDWLLNNRYLSCQEYYKRCDIYNIYTMKNTDALVGMPYTIIKNKKIGGRKLIPILESVGFVYP